METTDKYQVGKGSCEERAVRFVFRDEPGVGAEQPQTKACPFCAETIQARAVKCRFCGEFLNTARASALTVESDSQSGQNKESSNKMLFRGRPSLWALSGAVVKGLIFLGFAVFLVRYPLEELPIFRLSESSAAAGSDELVGEATEGRAFELTEQQLLLFGKCRVVVGAGLAAVVVLVLLLKMIRLKMIYYEVTPDRIEWGRGILDRRVDNLDMFRVVDLRLRRSLLDCMVGVGTVALITTDKTDPEFVFKKVHNSRRLYDIIKKASLDADQRNAVVHLE